jgi:hypothetical protein
VENIDTIKTNTAQAEPFDCAQDMLVEARFASLSTVPYDEGRGNTGLGGSVPLSASGVSINAH